LKKTLPFFALALASLTLTAPRSSAQNNPLITFHETGVGSLVFPGGGSFVTTGVLAPDPGPGGLSSALTFNLLGPPSLVAGDLILNVGGVTADMIRFNPAGTGGAPSYPASAVFYSTSGGGQLADTGFPTLNYATTFLGTESGSGFTYTPTASQPGFIGGFSVTYEIIATATPEPSSFLLVLGAGAAILARRRRKQNM
jgi:hypothetical protein